ncbi:MAG TPA: ATP-binding cassette domain-containing protein [Candidatus Limnocylindria bacterium]|nr:ATP-binding cassette domain-containing protein [Candidatus Limnocylindria bacterium]
MLQLTNISMRFGTTQALSPVSCTVQQGDFVVIVGTNGSGKTTLFDIIAGTITPTTGTIALNGQDITHISELKRSAFVTRLFQSTTINTVGDMTVYENLAMAQYQTRIMGLQNGTRTLPRSQAQALLADLNLAATLDRPMWSLSGGQRQLLAFVMATLVPPKILLLDEPTAALDPAAATKLLAFANDFIKKHGITTLMITHDPHIALAMGNKLWVLENGHLTKQFEGEQKRGLSPEHLIGHIDYAALKG